MYKKKQNKTCINRNSCCSRTVGVNECYIGLRITRTRDIQKLSKSVANLEGAEQAPSPFERRTDAVTHGQVS